MAQVTDHQFKVTMPAASMYQWYGVWTPGIVDVEQLAVTPQCGFGTVAILQSVEEETQWRKLALIGAVADRVWSR